jgi:hypothetical protein
MSRWVDQFETHAFQATWSNFKTVLDAATVDDSTVITSVTEIARLKKVTTYIDEMLQNLDPELTPMTIWDSFNQQAASCSQQISMYTSNRNIGHIQNANTHIDNLLTYIRPYMVAPKAMGNVLNKAVSSYAKTIDEYAESFRNKSTDLVSEIKDHSIQSKEFLDSIENNNNEAVQFHEKLFGKDDSGDGIQNKVDDLVADFEGKHEEIVTYYNETLIGDTKTPSTKAVVLEAKKAILSEQGEISELLENISIEIEEFNKFYIRIFGKLNDKEEREGGLAGELNLRMLALNDFEEKQKIRYAALNQQIEDLLPGATSAGLASAYHDMKKSFDDPIKYASYVFYGAIGILVFASLFFTIERIGWSEIILVKISNWDEVLRGVTNKIPFYAPTLWLAFYASKRRSEYQRLQQEYAHKEALAKSYDSYKKQIELLDVKDLEMRKAFIMKAIDAIAYNASATLDGKHGDKMPAIEMIEKVAEEMSKMKNIFKPLEEGVKK